MPGAAPLQTPLNAWHRTHGARLVDFGGWELPVQFTTITEEHQTVRQRVGLFDISHMGRLTFSGPGACDWLERATTNRVARLAEGQIQYSLMVHDHGGTLDDVLVYRSPFGYTMVCNAANRTAVLARLEALRTDTETTLADRTRDTAMIAIQGPAAEAVVEPLFSAPLAHLGYYYGTLGRLAGAECMLSRTGYTGEDGFEIIVAAAQAEAVWNALIEAGRPHGIAPCGLGARDTLRFEAGMPLYGHELNESINPFEAGLGAFVALDKGDFAGRAALARLKEHVTRKRVGLALAGKRIARQGYAVSHEGKTVGFVTSGTFAPTLGRSLAMALVDTAAATPCTRLAVDVRGQTEPAEVARLPFYRRNRP